jgi:hypothetical protein
MRFIFLYISRFLCDVLLEKSYISFFLCFLSSNGLRHAQIKLLQTNRPSEIDPHFPFLE